MLKEVLNIIEKARLEKKQKSGTLAYWLKIDNNFQLAHVSVSFLKKDRLTTKHKLEEIQNTEGFMFWVDSDEGEAFFIKNYIKIITDINTQKIKPWLDYEYKIKK